MAAEAWKLRRSPVSRLVWLLPLLFAGLEFLCFERLSLGRRALTPDLRASLDAVQIHLVVFFWGGFFHPLMLALLPALILRPEHRCKTWRHLGAMPGSRRGIFLAKAASVLALSAFMLALVALLLLAERRLLGALNPLLAFPFHGFRMFQVLGWLWLGSLPALGFYLWVSDRISSLAVPVVIGLAGLILAIFLSGQDLYQPWRRDLIPWVLPYAAAERVIHTGPGQQEAQEAGGAIPRGPDTVRMPHGTHKNRTWTDEPIDSFLPPAPPTPAWVLAAFSCAAGALALALGWLDAGRRRI
jgi:hypothetical protein